MELDKKAVCLMQKPSRLGRQSPERSISTTSVTRNLITERGCSVWGFRACAIRRLADGGVMRVELVVDRIISLGRTYSTSRYRDLVEPTIYIDR
jgi:hypothetical protein